MSKRPKMNKDEHLVKALQQGKAAAFETMYRKYYRMVENYVTKNKGTEEDAQDIFQEALLAIVRNIQKPEFTLSAQLSTYVYSIASRLWLMKLRKRKERVPLEVVNLEERIEDSEEVFYEKELFEKKHALMSKVLKELKEDCQQLLINYYYKRINLKQIGRIMGYSEGFVKVKKNRCMNAFKKKVKEHPDFQKIEKS